MTPGVAARAHQRPEADRRGDPLGRLAGDALGLVERGPDGREHVRPGVAVGDRVDVEAVDLVDVGLEVGDRGPEGLEQPGAVAGPPGHQATSVPLSARSRGRMAVGSRGDHDRRRTAGLDPQAVDVDDEAVGPPVRAIGRARSGRPNRPGGRPRRPGRRGRPRGRARCRRRRRGGPSSPGWARSRRARSATERTAGEPGHAVRAEGRGADDVHDRAAGDEGAAGRRLGWHAGDVLLAWRVGRRPSWASEAVWYPTASVRAGPGSSPPNRSI